MGKNGVYIKTAAGEEAVRQRTRLVQRNLRNVLSMVETFERRIAREMNLGHRDADPVALVADPAPDCEEAAQARPAVPGGAFPSATTGPRESVWQPLGVSSEPPPALPPQVELAAEYPAAFASMEAEPVPACGIQEPVSVYAPSHAPRTPLFRRLADGLAALRHRLPRPRPRAGVATAGSTGRRTRRALPRAGVALTLVLLIPAVAVLTLPFDRLRGDVEQVLSEASGLPVRAGHVHFVLESGPALKVDGASFGRPEIARIDSIRLVPDFLSLLSQKKILREVRLESFTMHSSFLPHLVALGLRGMPRSAIEVQRILFNDAGVSFGGELRTEGMKGDVTVMPGGAFGTVHLGDALGTLVAELQPGRDAYAVALRAANWSLPFGPPVRIESLEARGELNAVGMRLNTVEGRLYDGIFRGRARIEWADSVGFATDLEFQRVDLAKTLPMARLDVRGNGELFLKLHVESKAETLSGLGDALRAEGALQIQ